MNKATLFDPTSRLQLVSNQQDVVIRCRGTGLTFGAVLGVSMWSLLTLGGLTLFLLILAALAKEFVISGVHVFDGDIDVYSYLFAFAVSIISLVIGGAFLLQSYQGGWNDSVVTIGLDRIAVRYEGKYAARGYSFPLSHVKQMGVYDNQLSIKFWVQDYRTLLCGSEAEVEWVENLILERMKLSGWSCGHLERW